jgi:hypothetical protein
MICLSFLHNPEASVKIVRQGKLTFSRSRQLLKTHKERYRALDDADVTPEEIMYLFRNDRIESRQPLLFHSHIREKIVPIRVSEAGIDALYPGSWSTREKRLIRPNVVNPSGKNQRTRMVIRQMSIS